MSKFFNEDSARCPTCEGRLLPRGLAGNDKHLYTIGTIYRCRCGASSVWTNSVRNPQALLDFLDGSSPRYFQGFCNDLFDGKRGKTIMPLRSVYFAGERQRGQVYGYDDTDVAVVWSNRFWPEQIGHAKLIEWYAKHADVIRRAVAANLRSNPENPVGYVDDEGKAFVLDGHKVFVHKEKAAYGHGPYSRAKKMTVYVVTTEDGELLTDPHATRREALAQARRSLALRENPVGYVDDESFAAVDHFPSIRPDLFADRSLLNQKASVRLDIPSSKPVNKGGRDTVVVTVHEPSSTKRVVGYDHTAVVENALFQVTPAAARDIALGIMNKTPFSYVTGKLVGAGIEGQRAEAVGVPVYYDPRVVHLYVDARNGLPIKAASEVNFRYVKGNDDYYLPEIEGIYIWAVDPVYYAPDEAPGSVLGAKYGNTAPSAWDWAMTTPFKLTGTPAKVVMPEASRENPGNEDDDDDESGDFESLDHAYDALLKHGLKHLPRLPTKEDLAAAVAADHVVDVVMLLNALGVYLYRFPTDGEFRVTYEKLRERSGVANPRQKALFRKYGAIFARAVGAKTVDFTGAEYAASGRGVFGRLGGGRRAKYNAAGVSFKE